MATKITKYKIMALFRCTECKKAFEEPQEIEITYEKYFGVSDEFPNHNTMTLRVCPFCGSADIEKFNAHIKCEEDEKDYDYAEESEN